MTDAADPAFNPPTLSAGTLLRQARMAKGLPIAALAAQMKVSPRKLEALEADRFEELPDATFVRALAQAICRHLGIEAEPVLARLPQPRSPRLEHASRGLDAPFRERPGRYGGADQPALWTRPVVWGPALILIAALALYTWPEGWRERMAALTAGAPAATNAVPAPAVPASAPEATTTPATEAPAPAASAPPPVVETVHSAPAGEPAVAAKALVLRTSADSWVEVTDGRGRSLLARSVQAGETLGLDGTPPLKVRINNAKAMQVSYRGQPVDLAGVTRDNIARLELK